MPAPLPSAGRVQSAVARVYARPEYNHRPGFGDWMWRRVMRVLDWIVRRIDDFAGMRHAHPVVFWAVVGWMALTALAIVGHLVWTALQARKLGQADARRARGERARPRGAADWDAEAVRLAAEGRLREAAVALYQAMLLRLDARGAVRYDPSKTPGDYRREARPHAEVARGLAAFLRLFEPVVFGGRSMDVDGWERMRAAAAAVGGGAGA